MRAAEFPISSAAFRIFARFKLAPLIALCLIYIRQREWGRGGGGGGAGLHGYAFNAAPHPLMQIFETRTRVLLITPIYIIRTAHYRHLA